MICGDLSHLCTGPGPSTQPQPASATHLPSVSISLIISIFCENKLSISSSSSFCVCFWAQLKKLTLTEHSGHMDPADTDSLHQELTTQSNLVGKHDKVLK